MKIKNTYKNIKRSKEIVEVFARHGIGYIFDATRAGEYLSLGERVLLNKSGDEKTAKLTAPQRLRMAFEELGPTFIKLGQVLSTRPDLLGPDFIKEFEKLQDKVSPISYSVIKRQVEEEYGKPISEVFASFSQKSIAAASLSQVHKAKLKSGEKVVVKIRRPGVKKIVEEDIAVFYELVDVLETKWIDSKKYSPKDFVDEFANTIREEMDFSQEARNAEKFSANFAGNETVKIPKIYENLTSEKILVLEFIDGIKIDRIKKLENRKLDRRVIASNGVNMVMKQVFEDGFFHGDLHPGNIFVLKNNAIALVDFGMVGHIDRKTMGQLADVMFSLTKFDTDGIVKGLEKMGIIEADTDVKKIKREINRLIDRYYGLELKDLYVGKILADVLEVIRKNNIKIPSDFTLLFKTVITAENIACELDPKFDMVSAMQPFVENLISKKYTPQEIFSQSIRFGKETLEGLRELPENIDWLFRSIRQGKLILGLEHKGLDRLEATVDRSSNRISFSLIISSLIIGSSLIINVQSGAMLFGYSALGVTGFVFAALLGIWLVISIIRGGKF